MSDHTPASIDETPSDNQERISAAELRARSHDLELLISLASTYALATLPSVVISFIASIGAQAPTWLLRFAQLVGLYVGALGYTLAFVFVVHLFLRAIWIAVIGMDTHFPQLKSWRSNKYIGPIAFEYTNSASGSREHLAANLDRWATTVFVLGITIVAIAVLGVVFGIIGAGLAFLCDHWFGDQGRYIVVAVVVSFVLLSIVSFFLIYLDRRYGLRQQTPGPRLRRAILLALRTQHFGPMKTLGKLLQPLFANRFGTYGYILVSAVFGACASIVGLQVLGVGSSFGSTIEASLLDGRIEQHYSAVNSSTKATATVKTFVVREPLVQLRLPYVRSRDADAMTQLCGDQFQSDLVACAKRYWKIEIDGADIAQADWLLVGSRGAFRLSNRLFIDVLLPLDQATRGLHRLKINRWQDPAKEKPDSVVGIPIYYLP
jgi:hypothetical protein